MSVRVPKKGLCSVFIEQYSRQDGKDMENPLLRSLMEFYREEVTLLAQNSTQHFKQMLSTLMIDICPTSGCFQSVGGRGFNI